MDHLKEYHEYCTGDFNPDDVVVSGMSGRFPSCESVAELEEALYSKKLLLNTKEFYEKHAAGLPVTTSGPLKSYDKFDADYFSIPYKEANNMDPEARINLEVCYESIADAGYDPVTLRGANIGIYYGNVYHERTLCYAHDETLPPVSWVKSMKLHYLSYAFDFRGPSVILDSACSTTGAAFYQAYNDLKEGRIDAAIVTGSQVCYFPYLTEIYYIGDVLTPTGYSVPFDADTDGLMRAESVSTLFLQKASDARRAYAKILSTKFYANGYNQIGIANPSLKYQIKCLKDCLRSAKVDPMDIDFIEAHGTGTSIGDPIELNSISAVFELEKRKKPLYIGSVKASIGHTECVSGNCGIIKTLIACEKGLISPHARFGKPNPSSKDLLEGKMKVVTETIPLTSPYVPVSTFGLAGTSVNVMLKRNSVTFANNEVKSDLQQFLLYPATTASGVEFLFDYIKKHPELPKEFFTLLHQLSFCPTILKPIRGYAFFDDFNNPMINIKPAETERRPVWFVYNGVGSQWLGMGMGLMKLDIFAESMKKHAIIAKRFGIDIFKILGTEENLLEIEGNCAHMATGIISIGVALTDVLFALDIKPDGIIGHSIGEIVAAYADGCITAEQAVTIPCLLKENPHHEDLGRGAVLTTSLTWEEAVRRCSENMYASCHNAKNSVTISGYKKQVFEFRETLIKENHFCQIVPSNGIAVHCPKGVKLHESMLKKVKSLLSNVNPRSKKWICTSYLEHEWNKAKVCNVDFFTHNMNSPVYFKEGCEKIPGNALTIEIGPNGILQPILKSNLGPTSSYVSLMKRKEPEAMRFFFNSIGKLYIEGLEPKIERLYPPTKFPVPRNTPRICDLIKWNHAVSYDVPHWSPYSLGRFKFQIDKDDHYLLDHYIDGRALFPATGLIYVVWKALAKSLKKELSSFPIVIENFKILRATVITPALVIFEVNILNKSGNFEVIYEEAVVATGKVCELKNSSFTSPDPVYHSESISAIPGADIYNELKMAGYEYGPTFQGLSQINMEGTKGQVIWQDRWIPFLDALLLFFGFTSRSGSFLLPIAAQTIKIDPNIFYQEVEKMKHERRKAMPVNFNNSTNTCFTYGIEINNLATRATSRRIKNESPTLLEYKFVPYISKYSHEKNSDVVSYMQACNEKLNEVGMELNIDVQKYQFPIEDSVINVDSYLENSLKKYTLLNCLQELSVNPDELNTEKCLTYFEDIGNDILNSMLTYDYALRIILEIILENTYKRMHVIELHNPKFPVISATLIDMVKSIAHVKFNSSTLITSENAEIDTEKLSEYGIEIKNQDAIIELCNKKETDFVISSLMCGSSRDLQNLVHTASTMVKSTGFILLYFKEQLLPIEKFIMDLSGKDFQIQPVQVLEKCFKENNLIVISKISDSCGGSVYLLRSVAPITPYKIIKVTSGSFDWVEKLKSTLAEITTENLWLIADDSDINGIVGMVNCLKQEPKGDKIRCLFLSSKQKNNIPHLSFDHPFYQELLNKNIVMNVWKKGTWGSYRHCLLNNTKELKEVEHSYINCRKFGDLSSLEWIESYVKYAQSASPIHIYYSAINFKDIMLATGKLGVETAILNPHKIDDSMLGLEFSGRDETGKRVAGIVTGCGIATSTLVDPLALIEVPDEWTLEDAATVPVVYATCYYGLLMRAQLQRGESILIHSGTGGVGMAAINIALSLDCEIFTTVGNDHKRSCLRKMFPQIKDENIGCSRDTSFENMIKERTNGRGVDVVLNSLADDKLQASIRCVAKHGRFIEIGKYDLSLDRTIGLKMFLNNITFHGVFMDQLFGDSPSIKEVYYHVVHLLKEGIKQKVVKPLHRTLFDSDEIETAFRYMARGIHVGKVILTIRDEEEDKKALPKTLSLPAVPITYFYAHKVYIVIGGLGGFGTEVTKWILNRGGRNIILTTRYGARTPYHHFCLLRWRKMGANVQILKLDASKEDKAEKLIQEAMKMGPVGGIFNSAVVLRDAFLDSQNVKKYNEVCAPKVATTIHLDTLSRKLCPHLDYFVCFSSISCGHGNAGQSNYGYANSVMERICEQRKESGLHGLAIQWGIIGEVGVFHRHMTDDAVIAGVCAQNVKSCLETLDLFCQTDYPVVTSYMAATTTKSTDQIDIVAQVAKILGMKDTDSPRSLGEIGMDSIIGVEIMQLLNSAFDITLSVNELIELKFSDIKAMAKKLEENTKSDKPKSQLNLVSSDEIKLPSTFFHFNPLISLNTHTTSLPVFIVLIGDNDIKDFKILAECITCPVYALLWTKSVSADCDSIESIAAWYLKLIQTKIEGPFHIIGYSLGGSLAVEIALISEETSTQAKSITLMHGSSNLFKNLSKEEEKQSDAIHLRNFIEQFICNETLEKLEQELMTTESLEEMISKVEQFVTASSTKNVKKADLIEGIYEYLKKAKITESYLPSKIFSKGITLIENPSEVLANDISEYKSVFSRICKGNVDVQRILQKDKMSEKETLQRVQASLSYLH